MRDEPHPFCRGSFGIEIRNRMPHTESTEVTENYGGVPPLTPLPPCETSSLLARAHLLDPLVLADARAAAVERAPLLHAPGGGAHAEQHVGGAGERGVPGGGAAVVGEARGDRPGHGACRGTVGRCGARGVLLGRTDSS